ncbi:MAG: SAM-dependent methyltransferase, partial [Ruminococcus sp.]|nr:SAM-dependent methyltransferase [Ruminococcus sp.]
MLDNRLKLCAELVSGKGIAVDVGTDHALLAAELINSGKCSKVIASDIKEGPLEAAARTVEKFGLADKIDLVLSDGIKNVPLEGVTDIVIAGMGGETIADIISVMPAEADAKLILQPMTKPEVLRKKLYE